MGVELVVLELADEELCKGAVDEADAAGRSLHALEAGSSCSSRGDVLLVGVDTHEVLVAVVQEAGVDEGAGREELDQESVRLIMAVAGDSAPGQLY